MLVRIVAVRCLTSGHLRVSIVQYDQIDDLTVGFEDGSEIVFAGRLWNGSDEEFEACGLLTSAGVARPAGVGRGAERRVRRRGWHAVWSFCHVLFVSVLWLVCVRLLLRVRRLLRDVRRGGSVAHRDERREEGAGSGHHNNDARVRFEAATRQDAWRGHCSLRVRVAVWSALPSPSPRC